VDAEEQLRIKDQNIESLKLQLAEYGDIIN